jgi:ADP-heptose:LPS heptosyltransferase
MPSTSCWPDGTDVAGHLLVVRLDSMGDMLAAGPAVRAVAAGADRVTVLCGPAGAAAASLLPGVDATVVWACPWIVSPPPPATRSEIDDLIDRIAGLRVDQAVILTSFHQSPLPTALLLRLAGVPRIVAASEDYPGSLLDARLPVPGDAPEPVRMLQTVRGAGFELPAGDDGRLRVRRPLPDVDAVMPSATGAPLVVVHPGTSAPARAYPEPLWASAVDRLVQDGWRVALTGSAGEQPLTGRIVGAVGRAAADLLDLAGRLDLPQLAAVLDRAEVTVVANTGPAHLSAAVGTPVVSLFAPVVPALRWAPFGVPVELLGDQDAPCRDTRWTSCRIAGHPCLSSVSADQIASAVRLLSAVDPAPLAGSRR